MGKLILFSFFSLFFLNDLKANPPSQFQQSSSQCLSTGGSKATEKPLASLSTPQYLRQYINRQSTVINREVHLFYLKNKGFQIMTDLGHQIETPPLLQTIEQSHVLSAKSILSGSAQIPSSFEIRTRDRNDVVFSYTLSPNMNRHDHLSFIAEKSILITPSSVEPRKDSLYLDLLSGLHFIVFTADPKNNFLDKEVFSLSLPFTAIPNNISSNYLLNSMISIRHHESNFLALPTFPENGLQNQLPSLILVEWNQQTRQKLMSGALPDSSKVNTFSWWEPQASSNHPPEAFIQVGPLLVKFNSKKGFASYPVQLLVEKTTRWSGDTQSIDWKSTPLDDLFSPSFEQFHSLTLEGRGNGLLVLREKKSGYPSLIEHRFQVLSNGTVQRVE